MQSSLRISFPFEFILETARHFSKTGTRENQKREKKKERPGRNSRFSMIISSPPSHSTLKTDRVWNI